MIREDRLKRELPRLNARMVKQFAEANFNGRQDVMDAVRGRERGGPRLAAWLKIPERELLAALEIVEWPVHAAVQLYAPCALGGVPRPRTQQRPQAFAAPRADLPDHISLLNRYGPPRNQGTVGTCTSYATVAMIEGQLADPAADLAEAFVYSITKSIDGHDGDGSWLEFSTRVLESHGVCREATWPYHPDREYLTRKPSDAALAEARKFQIGSRIQLAPGDVDGIRAELAAGHGVGLSVPIFDSTYASLNFHSRGRFRMRLGESDAIGGGHAMCIAGYMDDPWLQQNSLDDELGGGAFLLRNSWGADWAADNPHAARFGASSGYAVMPYEYVRSYAYEAFSAPLPVAGDRRLGGWWSRTMTAVAARSRSRLIEIGTH